MINQRTAAIFLLIIPVTCILGLLLLTMLTGRLPTAFYWGVPIGSILGIGTWFYLAKVWDPVNLQTKNGAKRANLNLLWLVIPGGIILARILPRLIGERADNIFLGISLTWIFLTVGFLVVQAWRHRPRN